MKLEFKYDGVLTSYELITEQSRHKSLLCSVIWNILWVDSTFLHMVYYKSSRETVTLAAV